MHNIDSINHKLKQLPDEKQREVADFVDFLLSRLSEPTNSSQILRDTAGIWKDETDGIAYENTMRKQWEKRA